jgi:hypothetical protein
VDSDPVISLVLMDIDLGSGMDGTETARSILEHHDLPIVFLTSHAEKEYVDRVEKITSYGYVLKNSGEFVLIESINMAYKLFQAHQDMRLYARNLRSAEQKSEDRRRYLEAILASVPIAIVTADGRNRIVEWNVEAENLFGYTAEEAVGRNIDYLVTHEASPHRREAADASARVLEAKRVQLSNAVRNRKDGSQVSVMISVAPIVEQGEVVGTVASYRDVGELKRAEEERFEYARRLHTLMENLPGMAYRCRNNRSWTMEFVSRGCHALTGYRKEELENNSVVAFADLILPEYREMVWRGVQEALSRKERFTLKYRIRTREGEIKWVWEQGEAVFCDENNVQHIEGFITDITSV